MTRRRVARFASALFFVGFSLAGARHAEATHSVVGVDTATRQVGGAGTSCLDGPDVHFIYGSVPGRGVLVAQALPNCVNRDRALELLAQGTDPEARAAPAR